jgi:hypothetical protein
MISIRITTSKIKRISVQHSLQMIRDTVFIIDVILTSRWYNKNVTGCHVFSEWGPESRGNALGLYSGGSRFESRLGRLLSWLRFLIVFSVLPGQCWDSTSIRPRPLPSKSFPNYHPTIRGCIVQLLKPSLNNPRKKINRPCGWMNKIAVIPKVSWTLKDSSHASRIRFPLDLHLWRKAVMNNPLSTPLAC